VYPQPTSTCDTIQTWSSKTAAEASALRLPSPDSGALLQRCSPSPRKLPQRSAPPMTGRASYRPRSSSAGCSLASATTPRCGNAPGPSPAGSRCPVTWWVGQSKDWTKAPSLVIRGRPRSGRAWRQESGFRYLLLENSRLNPAFRLAHMTLFGAPRLASLPAPASGRILPEG
jgi:hypothetical protein